ncbi:MAG: carbohydrate-binding domain-containing protein [Prevotella sp.]|jgi:hypothetical protein|nr:carbohydrate-binding domain-containing protein [Prevotella sp.]
MKRLLVFLFGMAFVVTASAINANTVEIVYNGNTAIVNVALNISSYVTVESGTSSHVRIVQDSLFAGVDKSLDNEDGEIIYLLSGSSSDGEFYLEGSYKASVQLKGLTLTNPSGPAINIQDGKRINLSVKKNTTATLADGVNEDYNGCVHCKGHLKLQGSGTLNVSSVSRHAIYSKEYLELKNLTLNITAAKKDGIHCKEYMLMSSGTVTINGVEDDGIQVELANAAVTGITTGHEDENTANFYMTGGKLTIGSCPGNTIKTDGVIKATGGTRNFDASTTQEYAGIDGVELLSRQPSTALYDLLGRKATSRSKGILLRKSGGKILVR